MSWNIVLQFDRKMSLRQSIFRRFFLLITCITFTISVILIKKYIIADSDLVQEAIQNLSRDYRYVEVYRKTDRLPKYLKYILLWSDSELAPFYHFGQGQRQFIEKNCSQINCYITSFKRRVNVNCTKNLYKLRSHDGKIMSWIILLQFDRKMSLRQSIFRRFFLLITCITFTISVILIKKYIIADSDLVQEAIQNLSRDYRYAEVYRKTDRLPKYLKYILLWSDSKLAPFYHFGQGQRQFIEKNCSQINCYITSNRSFFQGDTTKFDAIAFNGRSIITKNNSHFPKMRSPHQKFIYFNMESADNFPVCSKYFDNFFNWTATYRLDSDIPSQYIQIRDLEGEVVGPKTKMKWIDMGVLNDEELENRMQNKTKAVAWFVSHCSTRSRREEYVTQLKKALKPFEVSVDIYGQCGPFKCTKEKQDMCFSLLEKQYAFYLSFENSFAEDYVTEKLLTALQHNAVPIVLGGADYSRFLPPGSYIDAGKMTPMDLAAMIIRIMMSTKYYIQFFRWRTHYSYNDPSLTDNICAICEALNNKNKLNTTSTYKNFRKWWNPGYKYRCQL